MSSIDSESARDDTKDTVGNRTNNDKCRCTPQGCACGNKAPPLKDMGEI